MTTHRSAPRGFTLIELMIALVLFSFLISGVLAVAVSLTQGYRDQRAAIQTESAVRLPMDFLADVLRQASPAVSTGLIQDAATCTTAALTVTNNFGGNGWDQLDLIYASGAVATSSRTIYTTGTLSLDVDDATGLAVGDSIVISNVMQGHLVKITAIASNTLTLATQCATIALPSGGYPAGSIVVRAVHGIFFIGTVDGMPTLMMNPTGDPTTNATKGEPLAEGIEDMQIAIGYDVDGNSTVDEVGLAAGDDEWQGNFTGDSTLTGTLHAIRITLIARTTTGWMGNAHPFSRPASEDHAASATFDAYRRRVMRTIVEFRNLAGSP